MGDAHRVLVVEDDVSVQELIADALTDEGLSVRTAIATRHAAQLAEEECPELVVLDWMLPDGDGSDAARALRSHCPELPILVVTAASEPAEKAAQIGAVGYLSKPFDLTKLIDAVMGGLGRN